jgi:hypothetical protein
VTPQDAGFTQPFGAGDGDKRLGATWSMLRIRICASGAEMGTATAMIGRISPCSGPG